MKQKIVIIGAAIADVLVRPADARVFETGSFPAENIRLSFGGDALNEAVVLASLGRQVRLETVLGDDDMGTMVERYCESMGIEVPSTVRKPGLTTGINVVLVGENGERSFLTNRNGSLRKLAFEDITLPFPADANILCFASVFVSPQIDEADMVKIFRQAKEQGMIVCADMTKPKRGERVKDIAKALAYIDYFIPNREEAFMLTGEDSVEEAAECLLQAGVKNVIIKCGSEGCYIRKQDLELRVDAVPNVNCMDTTGAGDSFVAGFLYGLSEGWGIEQCAKFANECGAKAVQCLGAVEWCCREAKI